MSRPRKPSESAPERMRPLARLPVFFALQGRRVVVAGGSPPAAWKAELLIACGAEVAVFAADPCAEMLALNVIVHRREVTAADLEDAALAVGAYDDDASAAAFAAMAREAGVPVNVVDKPAFCDFSFGAIVNRSPLVVGISTDGAAPVFAQSVRARIEGMLPMGFARWAEAARRWRAEVQASGLSFAARRRFWQLFSARAMYSPDATPGEDERDALLAAARDQATAAEAGSVTLVGAGPGDPELLTLRAVRAMQSADVILIDDLVAPEILDFARREAKKLMVGKSGHGAACDQREINTLMVALARQGKRVVRLKGGDPLLFARAEEEIAACRAAGITVEVVPGITAAQGAASRLGVPFTARGKAQRLQFITGHDRKGALPPDIDWASLADPMTTTAVYMPTKTLGALVERALANGLAPATPAAAIVNATRPGQCVIAATVADLPARVMEEALPGPLLVVIGQVMREVVEAAHKHAAGSETQRAIA